MPTADDVRALARSSPWRWRTLHLRRNGARACEAWIRRPGDLVVLTSDGTWHDRRGGTSEDGPEPTYRADGLVGERPDGGFGFELTEDLLWGSYHWLAMLEPVELSDGVVLVDVRSHPRRGRETWWARARPVAGYTPRCRCCALLWAAEVDDFTGDEDVAAGFGYPDSYEVGLDVQTGIVVSIRPVGTDVPSTHLDVDVLDVDRHQGPDLPVTRC